MDDGMKTRVHNSGSTPTVPKVTTASDWDHAAQVPMDDLLEDLYTDEELEERKKRRAIFPFFDLPREVRDEIYHYAWSSIVFCYPHQDEYVVVRYGTDLIPYSIVRFPDWVGTNPQIEEEAMQQLHRHAVFSVVGQDKEHWHPLPRVGSHQWIVTVGAGTITIYPGLIRCFSPLLSLSKAAKVQVWGNNASGFAAYGSCMFCMSYWEPEEETRLALSAALAARGEKGESLRELDLTLMPSQFYHGAPDDTYMFEHSRWDFTLFEELPKTLKRLKIYLYGYRCSRHHPNPPHKLLERVQEECSDRAQAFMQELPGNEGGVTTRIGSEPSGNTHLKDTWFCEVVSVRYKRTYGMLDQ